ncbi:hypothetical protein ACFSTC_45565 [Nonomuraea ferruginea]
MWIPSRVPGSWTNEQAPPIERPADPLPTRNPANRGKQAYDFPETAESGATGPMPAVNASSGGDDYLPIFASVESAWFERGGSSGAWGVGQGGRGMDRRAGGGRTRTGRRDGLRVAQAGAEGEPGAGLGRHGRGAQGGRPDARDLTGPGAQPAGELPEGLPCGTRRHQRGQGERL